MTNARVSRMSATVLFSTAAIALALSAASAVDARQGVPAHCLTGGCTIGFSRVGSVRDAPPNQLLDVLSLVRGPKGELATIARTFDRVLVFGTNGTLLKSVGEKGTQRGQFMRVNKVIPIPGNQFIVRDFQLGIATVLDASFAVLRTAAAPHSIDLALGSGQYISAQHIRTPGLVGYPMHLLDDKFAVVRSFGADTPEYRSDMPRLMNRLVAAGPNNMVWAAAPGRYTFEEWDPRSGQRTRSLAVKSSWFVQSLRSAPLENVRVRPSSLIESIWHDGATLWSLSRVADAAWAPRPGPPTERPFEVAQYDRTFDWVLEAIDPSTGRVLASRRLSEAHWADAASQLLSTRVPSANPAEGYTVHVVIARLEVPSL